MGGGEGRGGVMDVLINGIHCRVISSIQGLHEVVKATETLVYEPTMDCGYVLWEAEVWLHTHTHARTHACTHTHTHTHATFFSLALKPW